MVRLPLMLGGVSIAAVLAVAFALVFFAGGEEGLVLVLGMILTGVLVRLAVTTRFFTAALTVIAIGFAMIAGALMANGLNTSAQWLAALAAMGAAMFCGSIVALRRFNQRTRVESARLSNSAPDPQDSTVEMEVRPASSRTRRTDAPARLGASWRPAAALTAAGVIAAIVLQNLPAESLEEPVARGTADSTVALPVASASAEPDAIPVLPVETPADAAPQAEALSTRLVTRTVTPSLARRECLAQVESAHLFMQFARNASSASLYTRLTNPEIKRLAASRPVGPKTLQHIAQRMWDRRLQPEREAAWWSRQYARCEETRIDGGAYVVRG